MRLRACFSLLLFLFACATSAPGPEEFEAHHQRLANLQRAAQLPWRDGGQCVVQKASLPWPILAEQCYQVLDHDRVQFHDLTGRCSVASVGAATMGLGLCVLAAPEIVVGAVIITGVVVVGFAIKEALEVYEPRMDRSPKGIPGEEKAQAGAKRAGRPSLGTNRDRGARAPPQVRSHPSAAPRRR